MLRILNWLNTNELKRPVNQSISHSFVNVSIDNESISLIDNHWVSIEHSCVLARKIHRNAGCSIVPETDSMRVTPAGKEVHCSQALSSGSKKIVCSMWNVPLQKWCQFHVWEALKDYNEWVSLPSSSLYPRTPKPPHLHPLCWLPSEPQQLLSPAHRYSATCLVLWFNWEAWISSARPGNTILVHFLLIFGHPHIAT